MIVEIVKICQDLSRNLDIVKAFSENDEKSRRIEKSLRENTKIHALSIEIETNCRVTPKFSDLDEFLDRDFLVWTLMSKQNREVSILTEISRLS